MLSRTRRSWNANSELLWSSEVQTYRSPQAPSLLLLCVCNQAILPLCALLRPQILLLHGLVVLSKDVHLNTVWVDSKFKSHNTMEDLC